MNYIKIGLLIILVGFIIYFYNSYSNLKKDEDVANTENQELRSKVVNLYDYASKNMFFTSTEMLKKDYSLIEEFYKEEPRLLEHENNLKDSFRYIFPIR